MLLKTVTNGSSEMVAMMASGITTVMMNNIIMDLRGEDGVAAISILIYAMSLLTSIYMGYGLGIAPVTSFNHGAGNTANLKKEHKINLIVIAVMSAVMYALGFLALEPLISIFADKGTSVFDMSKEGYMPVSYTHLTLPTMAVV